MICPSIPVFFIGCVKSSEVALKTLLNRSEIKVSGVLTLRASKFNADFVDIGEIAIKACVLLRQRIGKESFG